MSRKIIDSFIFYNELPLLDMRLNELHEHVDYFVLVEMNVSFTGNRKPHHFLENRERYKRFWDKLIYITDMGKQLPDTNNPWRREYYQRNLIRDAIDLNTIPDLSEDDIVLVSDVDEIPSPEAIKRTAFEKDKIYFFEQRYFYYNFSSEFPFKWKGTMGFNYDLLYDVDLNMIRKDRYRDKDERVNYIPDGGWHCSYFGGEDQIIDKIEQFSHQEYNKPEYKNKETIAKRIRERKDLFAREDLELEFNDELCDRNLPKHKNLAYLSN
ncbi:hypothetical protein CMI37_34460 [Candidatus Pacearchaeota archaeon]|nr:hypothetical protein [Candidatus Pacearchaeota archaeon]|tara:strand:+ start:2730 stop:3530 length:801 start_codon:yes stop_codon:yes gene_type:complete